MRSIVTASMVMLILVGTLIVAFDISPAQASGTIYIRADGSVDPPTAPISSSDNVTYAFTDDINDPIAAERNNIVLDGTGYALQGTGDGYGIDLFGRTNVTVRNTQITNFGFGIYLDLSSNTDIRGNTITANNWAGIHLSSSSNNSIIGNTITANNRGGIRLLESSNYNSVSDNTFTHDGLFVRNSYLNTVENNTVNGKPLAYFEGVADRSVGDAGQVILVSCDSVKVENLNLSGTNVGVQLLETTNSVISGNTIANNLHGVLLDSSSNSTITSNTMTTNGIGIGLTFSSNSCIIDNTITNNGGGIGLSFYSNYNKISDNTITASDGVGIGLNFYSSYNSISSNTIAYNWAGIQFYVYDCSNNRFYHNNFIDNGQQVRIVASGHANVWDDGYPFGGNYWSDYTDVDSYKGQHQNETGNDGVWDHPYLVDESTQDRYPLTQPCGEPAGDVDGDRDVDIFDIVQMAGVYGADYPDPRYDRLCDVDLDGDIDIFDVVKAAVNYDKSW
jgi:parallel beta-helix repeat protein